MSGDEITNSADIIDSRDVIARIEDLEAEDLDITGLDENKADELATIHEREDKAQELTALRDLAADGENNAADWKYGAALIRDSYFTEYAQQMAEDVGAISSDAQWPLNRIDWDAAADDLKVDYSTVEFDGVTYWVRA